jgi:hypothetical protein
MGPPPRGVPRGERWHGSARPRLNVGLWSPPRANLRAFWTSRGRARTRELRSEDAPGGAGPDDPRRRGRAGQAGADPKGLGSRLEGRGVVTNSQCQGVRDAGKDKKRKLCLEVGARESGRRRCPALRGQNTVLPCETRASDPNLCPLPGSIPAGRPRVMWPGKKR